VNLKLEEVFSKFNKFEVRQNQLIMSKNVEDSLKNNKKLLIEAPT
jgi:Rad3-related DNA helicase